MSLTRSIQELSDQMSKVKDNGSGVTDSKQELEFSRYKQDCRKRAVDLAYNQWDTQYRQFQTTKAYSEGQLFDFDILKRADEYYNWLISIPQ